MGCILLLICMGIYPDTWSGTMGAEVYENTIGVGSKGCDLMDIRGGKQL